MGTLIEFVQVDGAVQMKHIPIVINGVKNGLYEIYEDGRIWSNYKNDFLIPKSTFHIADIRPCPAPPDSCPILFKVNVGER